MKRIDLNCDLGEGFANDRELMSLITSANMACGGHAGDPATMRATVALAEEFGVGIGAHPGYEDPGNFGRQELALSPWELQRSVERQLEALAALGGVRHVKPHGALYNVASRDRGVADSVVAAIRAVNASLILFAPPASELAHAGDAGRLTVAREAFADRRYQANGSLVPRSQPAALIETEEEMIAQLTRLVVDGCVTSIDGTDVPLKADTICLHGDGPHAVAFARMIRNALRSAGVAVETFA